jgi:exopolyphosphatase/guanosine-5'-triphosphate,3'-diphosphate pyrophosphatase
MVVGVVDVGANTARLLVAGSAPRGVARIAEARVALGLGAEIERRGAISRPKLRETAAAVDSLVSLAGEQGCARVDVLVTSPGRQSRNPDDLERALGRVRGVEVRVLSAEEEGRLAYVGALACTQSPAGRTVVCDVGGGSAQIVDGARGTSSVAVRSIDIGSLRVTRRFLHSTPPKTRELRAAQVAVRQEVATAADVPTVPFAALATGGTARALRKIVGPELGPEELAEALDVVSQTKPRRVARTFRVPAWRAAVLPAGALIMSEIQAQLGVPLTVASGGLREGAALRLLRAEAAVAA